MMLLYYTGCWLKKNEYLCERVFSFRAISSRCCLVSVRISKDRSESQPETNEKCGRQLYSHKALIRTQRADKFQVRRLNTFKTLLRHDKDKHFFVVAPP